MRVLYVPGKGTSRANYPYDKILRKIQRRGHQTTFCHVAWPRSAVVGDWLDQVRPTYLQCDPAQTILVGFSFGAMIAFLLAAERPPAAFISCSMPSYFAEDLPLVPLRWVRQLTPQRYASFKELHFNDIAPKVTYPTRFVIGGREPGWGQQRSRTASKLLPDSKLLVAQGVGHAPAAWPYITALDTAFDTLRGPQLLFV